MIKSPPQAGCSGRFGTERRPGRMFIHRPALGATVLFCRWSRSPVVAPQLFGARRLWDGAAWHDPSHWLSGYCGNEVVVAVVVQERDLLSFRHGGDQQIGEAD